MNIPQVSMALANIETANSISTAVLSKALDNNEAAGDSLINMMDRSMELSVNPNIGSNIDLYI